MAIYVTVTFDGGGAESVTPVSREILVTPGAVYGDLAVAVRAGYDFAGWWTGPYGLGTRIYEDTPLFSEQNHTLFACWTEAEEEEEETYSGFELTPDRKWVHVTPEAVAASLPATLKAAYESWMTAGERLEALALIVESVTGDFRSAVAAASHPVGRLADDLVPLAILRHVLAGVHCWLAGDTGLAPADVYRVAGERSEMYLRRLLIDLRSGNNRFAETGGGTPRYSGKRAAAGGGPAAAGEGNGLINYGIY